MPHSSPSLHTVPAGTDCQTTLPCEHSPIICCPLQSIWPSIEQRELLAEGDAVSDAVPDADGPTTFEVDNGTVPKPLMPGLADPDPDPAEEEVEVLEVRVGAVLEPLAVAFAADEDAQVCIPYRMVAVRIADPSV